MYSLAYSLGLKAVTTLLSPVSSTLKLSSNVFTYINAELLVLGIMLFLEIPMASRISNEKHKKVKQWNTLSMRKNITFKTPYVPLQAKYQFIIFRIIYRAYSPILPFFLYQPNEPIQETRIKEGNASKYWQLQLRHQVSNVTRWSKNQLKVTKNKISTATLHFFSNF